MLPPAGNFVQCNALHTDGRILAIINKYIDSNYKEHIEVFI